MKANMLSELDRNYIVVFEEISIHPDLRYNIASDEIKEIVDYGDGNREAVVANTKYMHIYSPRPV